MSELRAAGGPHLDQGQIRAGNHRERSGISRVIRARLFREFRITVRRHADVVRAGRAGGQDDGLRQGGETMPDNGVGEPNRADVLNIRAGQIRRQEELILPRADGGYGIVSQGIDQRDRLADDRGGRHGKTLHRQVSELGQQDRSAIGGAQGQSRRLVVNQP